MNNQSQTLAHFGIFGMRWGVRRFQNEDGTLTEEGKKRYSQRQDQLEGAKYHIRKNIERSQKDLADTQKRAEQLRKQPIDKTIEELWGSKRSALLEEESMDRIKEKIKWEVDYWEHKSDVAKERIRDQQAIMDKLSKVKVNVIDDDNKYKKQIEDLVADGTAGMLRYMILQYMYNDSNEYVANKSNSTASKPKKTLTQRFHEAQKDNPKLTYDQIYKEMKVDMNSEDPDDYKEAEAAWFKKHGY